MNKAMKATYLSLTLLLGLLLSACADELESGKGYPALETGTRTLVFRIDRVMQNDEDVKPYFSFFDEVELTLGYRDGQPSTLTFSESGAPFRVAGREYVDVPWEIYTAKSPYEIRDKTTGEVICYITRDRLVTFPFRLGAPSNKYEYRLLPVEENNENE